MGFPNQVSEFTSLYTPLMAPWLRILNSGPVYTSEAKRGSCPFECSTAPQPFRSERGKVVFHNYETLRIAALLCDMNFMPQVGIKS